MPVMEEKKFLVVKETFIARVDKNVTSNELKTFLCNDDEALKRTVQLSILLSKLGQPQGYAFVIIPKSKTKRLLRKNGCKLRGKTFTLLPSADFHLPKGSRWKTEEDGVYKATPLILASYITVANNNKPIPFRYNMIDCGSCILRDRKIDYCIEDILDRAAQCGVEKIVLYCSNVEEARKAKRLSKLFPDLIYYTVGCDAWKDFFVDVNELIPTMKEKEPFLNVAEGCNMKALRIAFVLPLIAVYTFHKCDYEYMLHVVEYQIKWAIDLKIKAVVVDNSICYGSFRFLHVFIDDLFKIFDSFNDTLPPIAITSDGLREEQLSRLVERGYYVIITGYPWNTEPPTSSIRNWLWNLPDKYLCQILISTSVYHINFVRTFRTKMTINKICYPEESSALTNKSLDLFQEYLGVSTAKSGYFPMEGNDNAILPIVMPCLVELVAANIQHKTPTELAQITKKNAERFYCFEELQETTKELKEPLKKLKPCVSLLTTFQELPPCDKLFWIIFCIIVLVYIHIMFINSYCPEIYILLIFTYICFYLVQCIFKRNH